MVTYGSGYVGNEYLSVEGESPTCGLSRKSETEAGKTVLHTTPQPLDDETAATAHSLIRAYPDSITVGTEILRPEGYFDVNLTVGVRLTYAGHRQSWDEPAAPAEFDVVLLGVEFDGDHSDSPAPISEAERRALRDYVQADPSGTVYEEARAYFDI